MLVASGHASMSTRWRRSVSCDDKSLNLYLLPMYDLLEQWSESTSIEVTAVVDALVGLPSKDWNRQFEKLKRTGR